ncbi:MAG: hypothetical protein JNN12_01145 [Bacteroidetes Order II. Incertae sedis bacterium]|nr:hypothetical protein [Bacteroidetes Order II. bacterium]
MLPPTRKRPHPTTRLHQKSPASSSETGYFFVCAQRNELMVSSNLTAASADQTAKNRRSVCACLLALATALLILSKAFPQY